MFYYTKCFYGYRGDRLLLKNDSFFYMSMFDASKAFDRVNLLTLFKILCSRGMCPIYLRLLMKIYEEQQMRIRWNNSVSDYFTISNGVKQDGVLCPVLFSIYLEQLIAQLRHLGMGCYMNNFFMNKYDISRDDWNSPINIFDRVLSLRPYVSYTPKTC